MAAKSSLKNMLLCLTLVCLLCSALLALVYSLTLEPIRTAADRAQAEAVGKVLPEGVNIGLEVRAGQQMSYFPAVKDGKTIGYAVKSSADGFGGRLSIMVGVLADGTIFNTSVLDASGETPGLGAKCTTDEKFISQWRGFAPDKILKVRKDGGDVDAITASTITSRGYTEAVARARDLVKSLGGKENE